MTDYTNLIHRLKAAAEDMQHGVHTPGHIAVIEEAAKALEAIDKLTKAYEVFRR